MSILFPLIIVAVVALKLAASDPQQYAAIMHDAHLGIAAFGGTFLMIVALAFFFDEDKDIHWLPMIENNVRRLASIRGVEIAFVLLLALLFSSFLEGEERMTFMTAALYVLLTFLIVDDLGNIMDSVGETMSDAARGGLGAFLYLEVLDASFSFDGVIGAFALTQNLFVIAIGLGIGAMYVRSMTIMLVEKGTLPLYKFLENGAFYAILILSVIMYVQALAHVPEVLTGLGGATIIGVAFWFSVRYARATA